MAEILRVHRCRFVELTPSTIVAIAVRADGALVAVGRENGDIEIWDAKNGYICQSRISGNGEATVQALFWSGKRLFSAGFNAHIVEWDLNRLLPLRSSPSYGGAVWCAAPSHNGSHVALGCEDGSVRLLRLVASTSASSRGYDSDDDTASNNEPVLAYDRAFARQSSRVLSIGWSFDDTQIACGDAAGCIRLWQVEMQPVAAGGVFNIRSATSLLRITVGSLAAEPALVWALAFLPDGQLVSGDSLGRTQFWDARHGTLVHAYRQHEADVLAVAVDAARGAVYASGIDNKLVQFRCAPSQTADGEATTKWIPVASTRAHSHDVRAVAVLPPRVSAETTLTVSSNSSLSSPTALSGPKLSEEELCVSGGIDTQLCVYRAWAFAAAPHSRHPISDRPRVLKLAPDHNGGAQAAPCFLARAARLVLVQRPRSLQLWRLGDGVAPQPAEVTTSEPEVRLPPPNLDLLHGAVLALEVRLRQGGLHLCASAVSDCGNFVACSDPERVRLFRVVKQADNQLVVNPLPLDAVMGAASALTFSSDSQRLIAGCLDGCVRVVQLPEGQGDDASLTVTHTFNQHLSAPAVATLSDSASVSSETSKSSVKAKRKGAPSPALAPLPSPTSSLTSAGSLSLPSTAASSASTSRLIRSLCVSVDGQWIASGDVSDRIHVFHVNSNHIQHHASLPALSALFMMADNSSTSKSVTCTHTSMSFHPTKPLLAIACSSNHFLLYDVAQRCLADYSKQTLGNFPAHLLAQEDKVHHIQWNPSRNNTLYLIARSFMCHVDLDKPVAENVVLRKRKAKEISKAAAAASLGSIAAPVASTAAQNSGYARGDNYRIVERYRPLVFGDFVGADELVLIECPWLRTVQQLPNPMYRGVYGKK